MPHTCSTTVGEDQHIWHVERLWELARDGALARGNPGSFTVNASVFAEGMYRRLGFTATGPVAEMHGIRFIPMRLEQAAV